MRWTQHYSGAFGTQCSHVASGFPVTALQSCPSQAPFSRSRPFPPNFHTSEHSHTVPLYSSCFLVGERLISLTLINVTLLKRGRLCFRVSVWSLASPFIIQIPKCSQVLLLELPPGSKPALSWASLHPPSVLLFTLFPAWNTSWRHLGFITVLDSLFSCLCVCVYLHVYMYTGGSLCLRIPHPHIQPTRILCCVCNLPLVEYVDAKSVNMEGRLY